MYKFTQISSRLVNSSSACAVKLEYLSTIDGLPTDERLVELGSRIQKLMIMGETSLHSFLAAVRVQFPGKSKLLSFEVFFI